VSLLEFEGHGVHPWLLFHPVPDKSQADEKKNELGWRSAGISANPQLRGESIPDSSDLRRLSPSPQPRTAGKA
jgi:hypothetical protein